MRRSNPLIMVWRLLRPARNDTVRLRANLLLPQDFSDVVNSFFQMAAISAKGHVEHLGGVLLCWRRMNVGVLERAILPCHAGRCF